MTVATTWVINKATECGLLYDYATLIIGKYSGKQRNVDRERNYCVKFQTQNLRNINQAAGSGGVEAIARGTEESGRGLTSLSNELRIYVRGHLVAFAVEGFPIPAFSEILGGRHSSQ